MWLLFYAFLGARSFNWLLTKGRAKVFNRLMGGVFIGAGAALAITISWSVNKSIFWTIVHSLFSWVYVVYYAIT